MSRRILVFDTTLRDCEQSPGFSMNIPEKITLAKQLARLGVDVIEAGFPVASEGDFEAVVAIAREVRGPVIAGLSRAVPGDIDRCWQAIRHAAGPRIHTFIATSDIHIQKKFSTTREEILRRAVEAVRHAKGQTPDVGFPPRTPSAPTGTRLLRLLRARRGPESRVADPHLPGRGHVPRRRGAAAAAHQRLAPRVPRRGRSP